MNNIKAKKRENTASGFTNNLRKQGLIPAILYGGKNPNQNISVEKKSKCTSMVMMPNNALTMSGSTSFSKEGFWHSPCL